MEQREPFIGMPPRTSADLHRIIQTGFLLFLIWTGWRLLLHMGWAMDWGWEYVPRPPAAEGFLPISALMALKRLVLTGLWDEVHPAGLAILLFALLSAILLRRGFCGYVCPLGTISLWLFRLGTRLELMRHPPPGLTWLTATPKYVLLAFLLPLVLGMDLPAIEAFLRSPHNLVADSRMLLFFLPPGPATFAVILVSSAGSLFIPSFWCRCLCPYGALLGLASLLSPTAIRRDADACDGCGRCFRACPQGVAVHVRGRLSGGECVGCQECVSACPNGCLSMRLGWGAGRDVRLPGIVMGCATIGLLLLTWIWAEGSGRWTAELPKEMIRMLHARIMEMGQP